MTNLAAALADTSKLDPFEGVDVLAAGIEIPGAAGGLRDAMKIDPQQFHAGERLYVVLECDVAKIRFDPIQSGDEMVGWRRTHVLSAQAATFVDADLVAEAIASQKRKIELANEAANGIGRLPYDEDALVAHREGLHAAGRVPGCVECENEEAAELAEAKDDPGTGEPMTAVDGDTLPAPTPIAGRRKAPKAKP